MAHEDLNLHQVDIVSTYLQGELDEDIYITIPKGIEEPRKHRWYWKLKKALYGLKQAGRQWKTKLNEARDNLDFVRSHADDYLYIFHSHTEVTLLVLVYVDDMAMARRSIAHIKKFKMDIAEKSDITDLGELK